MVGASSSVHSIWNDFINRADRIVVYDLGATITPTNQPKDICYNVKNNAEFGVCKTDHPEYGWGFCSPSCKVKDWESPSKPSVKLPTGFEEYDVLNAKYFDKAPTESKYAQTSKRAFHILPTKNSYYTI